MLTSIRQWIRERQFYIGVIGLIMMLTTGFFLPDIIVIIRSGEAGVLYQSFAGGTLTDRVYAEGIHFIFPWNKMYIYNVRVQELERDFQVLTTRGLALDLKLTIRYTPQYDMLGLLHQRVGPDYATKVVIPQVESVVRTVLGRFEPEEIYTTQRGVLEDIVLRALEEAGQKFIAIDTVLIRQVSLPQAIRQAIEEKLTYEQQERAYDFRLALEEREAARKRIEAGGIRDYQRLISETLDDLLVKWQGIQATKELASSPNAKIVVIGAGEGGLPVILGGMGP